MLQTIQTRTICVVFILILFCTAGCDRVRYTRVEGHISQNTRWVNDQSPYLLENGDVTVDPGITLTIEPGVTVYFMGNNWLLVQGRLLAQGESGRPIQFLPFNRSIALYKGLKLGGGTQPDMAHQINYLVVQDADFGMYLDGSLADINFSVFSSNKEGIHLWNSNASIKNSLIESNQTVGISVSGGTPTLMNNQINKNGQALSFDYSTRPVFKQNQIGAEQSLFATIARCSYPLDLTGNNWGTGDSRSVYSKIQVLDGIPVDKMVYLEPMSGPVGQ